MTEGFPNLYEDSEKEIPLHATPEDMRKVEEETAKLYLRQQAYRKKLGDGSPEAEIILQDLANFVRLLHSNYRPGMNAQDHAYMEGMREPVFRILEHLELSPRQLFALYR